jgi:cytochrome c oxidase cbb3-type subunit 2
MASRFIGYFVLALIVSGGLGYLQKKTPLPESESVSTDLVSLGREVYVSEGCIHCHSQYVRPVGEDQALWGPPTAVETALSQAPVLIGNRRHGPDLANVGLRRDSSWNRLNLIEPSALVPGSRMPSYRHLFEGDARRGEALLAYLNSLRPSSLELPDSGNVARRGFEK